MSLVIFLPVYNGCGQEFRGSLVVECTWPFGYSSTGRPYVADEVMYVSLLAKFSPCVGRSESSCVELLRSLHSNLESVCSLVLCFRRSSLIVFKYCEPFSFWKSFFSNVLRRERRMPENLPHTAFSPQNCEKWTVRYVQARTVLR